MGYFFIKNFIKNFQTRRQIRDYIYIIGEVRKKEIDSI